MKKIWYSIIAGTALLECHTAQAVAIGDIYYSDKTFSAELVASKTPIGLVYWVSPGGDFGLIMQLEQPANTMNYYGANLYCNEYKTEGTKAGDWWLPERIELIRMGQENINGVQTDKFNTLNTKLPTIKKDDVVLGQQLVSNQYYWSNSYYGYLFKLNSTNSFTYTGTDDSPTNTTKYYARCVTAF